MKKIVAAFFECVSLGFHFIRGTFHLMYGVWKIRHVQNPLVSIFGSSRLKEPSNYLVDAQECARLLNECGISVLTGGGGGIMEAAATGAPHTAVGIGIRGLRDHKKREAVSYFIEMDYFWSRKWLLLDYSRGFIIFPGGFGTMDELSELLNLIQTKKLRHSPIVLIGSVFWRHYKAWLDEALAMDLISQHVAEIIVITDDLSLAVSLISKHCQLSGPGKTLQRQEDLSS
jgi:uncharacterized protein (TIGR00730 family)